MKLRLLFFVFLLLCTKVYPQSWTASTSGTVNYEGVFFTDSNTGYIVGHDGSGVIRKTTDGGLNWTTLTSGTSNALYAAHFSGSGSTGYVVGQNGTIRKTTNGGTTWTGLTSSTSETLRDVFFTDANTAFAVGYNGVIVKTTNGGTTWTTLTSGTTAWIFGCHFLSSTLGYASTNAGTILKTTNGTSWTIQSTPTANTLRDVYFIDNNNGYAVGNGGNIIKTVNGGTNWTTLTSGTTTELTSVYFTDVNNGFAVGASGLILKTTNGGTTWTPETTGITTNLERVFFPTSTTGYAVGNSGRIIKYQSPSEPTAQATGIAFADVFSTSMTVEFTAASGTPTGYLAIRKSGSAPTAIPQDAVTYSIGSNLGDGVVVYAGSSTAFNETGLNANTNYFYNIYAYNGSGTSINYRTLTPLTGNQSTYNSGDPWTLQKTLTFFGKDVHFLDANTGFVAGGYTLEKTTNGGASWTSINSTGDVYYSVYFTSSSTGYVSGSNSGSFVKKTTDGGANWTTLTTGITEDINSIFFVDANTGYIVGTGGKIAKTTNTGTTWTNQTSGTTANLNAVHFPNPAIPTTGYIVGSGGVILKTTNGGTSWAHLTSGTANELKTVHFNTLTNGYAAGINGTLLKTTNGGTSWSLLSTEHTDVFNDVFAVNGSTAYAVGSFGMVLKTVNGGTDWFRQSASVFGSTTDDEVFGIYLSNVQTGYAVSKKKIFKYQSVPEPTAQPTALVFSGITPTTLTLSFAGSVDGANGYLVLRKTGSAPTGQPTDGNNYTVGATIGDATVVANGSSTSLNESSLTASTQYFYSIYAYNTGGTAASTNYRITSPLSGNTSTVAAEPASQPTALVFSAITTTSFNAAFTAATGSPTGYIAIRKIGSAPSTDPADGQTYTVGAALGDATVVHVGSTVNFANTSLASGTAYFFKVYAYNGSGAAINYRQTTPLQNNTITLPVAPTASAPAAITQNSFTVSWTAVTGVANYLLDVSTDNFTTTVSSYNARSVTGTTENVTGLTPGTMYQYRVRANNASGASSNSNIISSITRPATVTATAATNVATASFTANWNPVNGVTGYQLDVSLDNFATFVSGYNSRSVTGPTENVIGLASSTTYQYRVRSVNASGAAPNSNLISATTFATGNTLTISQVTVNPTVKKGSTTKASITTSGGNGTVVVTLFYKGIMDTEYDDVNVVLLNGTTSTYETTLASTQGDELGIEYYFEATDGLTSQETQKQYTYLAIDDTHNEFIPFVNGFNGSTASYQMFSVPYVIDDKTIANVFEEMGAYNNTEWRLFTYTNGRYVEYQDGLNNIDIGKAYWFNARKQPEAIKPGAASTTEVTIDEPFVLNLAAGWNLIGNPYPFAIDWDIIKDANISAGLNSLWTWESAEYQNKATFNPWKGAFVFSDNGGSIEFPLSAKTNAGGRTRSSFSSSIDEPAWQLSIQTSIGNNSHAGGIGMHPEASLSKDRFDEITLPRFEGYVELKTIHEEFFAPDFSTDIITTAPTHQWKLRLASSQSTGIGTIRWNSQALSGSNATLILIDESTQDWVDMKQVGSYSFDVAVANQFTIYFSREGEIVIDKNLLGSAFPNPFVRDINIPVLVGKPDQTIAVEVFDLTGRKVRTIVQKFDRPGPNLIEWDGTDDSASEVAQGLFLYRLSTAPASIKRMLKN